MVKLKTCPFCGGRAKISTVRISNANTETRVFCRSCRASVSRYALFNVVDGKEHARMKAVEAWNARMIPSTENTVKES